MDFSHISFYSLSSLINFLVSFFFGVFVYFQTKTDRANRSFSFFMFFVAMYNICLFFMFQATSFDLILLLGRFSVGFAAFISVSYLYFIALFLGVWEKYKTFVKYGFVIFSLFSLAAVLPVDWMVKTMRPISVFDHFMQGGIFFVPFLVVWSIYFIFPAFVIPIIHYKNVDQIKKAQIRYLLLGIIFGNVGGLGNWILMLNIPILPPYLILSFMIFSFGYAVLKHHLFNAKMFAIEALTVSIWILLIIKILTSIQTGGFVFGDLFLFLSIMLIGIFLIRIGNSEMRQKESLQTLNLKLDNLNQDLAAQVAEQTQEIRKAYEVEKEARKELEKLNEAKNEFVLASQHNLRTPLTITKGLAEEIGMCPDVQNNPELKTLADKTKNSIDILTQLVNGLIDITDLKVGKEGFSKKG